MEIINRIKSLKGISVVTEGFQRTFKVMQGDHLLFVIKRLPFDPHNEFIAVPFDDVLFLNNNEKFMEGSNCYKVIRTIGQDRLTLVDAEQTVDVALSVYRNADNITFLTPQPFRDWQYFVEVDRWTDILLHYPPEELYPIINKWKSYFTPMLFGGCTRGWFHMDFYHRNVLTDGSMKYMIDFDTACLSYTALNVAQAIYIECFHRYLLGDEHWTLERVRSVYQKAESQMNENDRPCFRDLVKLMGFYWHIRTVPINYLEFRIARLREWNDRLSEIDTL